MIRSFVLRMAWRESRGARRRLGLLTGAIAAGVAALVAVNSFAANLRDSVSAQAQALLGADLSLASGRPFTPRALSLLDSILIGGAAERQSGGNKQRVPLQRSQDQITDGNCRRMFFGQLHIIFGTTGLMARALV